MGVYGIMVMCLQRGKKRCGGFNKVLYFSEYKRIRSLLVRLSTLAILKTNVKKSLFVFKYTFDNTSQ